MPVTYGEACQTLSDDSTTKYWAEIRIAHHRAGCNLPCCRGHWQPLRAWLRCKGRGIAACLRGRP